MPDTATVETLPPEELPELSLVDPASVPPEVTTYHWRCAFRAVDQVSGVSIVNSFHVQQNNLTSGISAQGAVDDIYAWLGQLWRNILSADMLFQDVTGTTLEGSTQPDLQAVHLANVVGTRNTADRNLSEGLCAVTSWKTTTPKRYARGRTFWPPAMTQTAATGGGKWGGATTYMAAVNAFVAGALTPKTVGDATYNLEVFSLTQQAKGLAPYHFDIVAAQTATDQHFLRSRTTSP